MTTDIPVKRYNSSDIHGGYLHCEEIGRSDKKAEATKKRLRAGRMLLAGIRPAKVAEKVGVARQTVYTWQGLLDEGGIDALRAVPPWQASQAGCVAA